MASAPDYSIGFTREEVEEILAAQKAEEVGVIVESEAHDTTAAAHGERVGAVRAAPANGPAVNRVARFFNKLEQFRRFATRYDKLAKTFLAAVCLVAAFLIIRNSRTLPKPIAAPSACQPGAARYYPARWFSPNLRLLSPSSPLLSSPSPPTPRTPPLTSSPTMRPA